MKLHFPSQKTQNMIHVYAYLILCSFVALLLIAFTGLKTEKVVAEALDVPYNTPTRPIELQASITKYTRTGYNMANGQKPYVGAVAISDYSFPLGSQVIVDGCTYTIADRTARWVHEQKGLTFDFFTSRTPKEALLFGRQSVKVMKTSKDGVMVFRIKDTLKNNSDERKNVVCPKK